MYLSAGPFQRASGRITEYFPSIFIFHFPLHRLAPNSAPISSSSQIDLLYLSFLFNICPSFFIFVLSFLYLSFLFYICPLHRLICAEKVRFCPNYAARPLFLTRGPSWEVRTPLCHQQLSSLMNNFAISSFSFRIVRHLSWFNQGILQSGWFWPRP